VALGLFIWGFNFLKGKDVFSKERIFYAEYREVNGLVKANPVLISGLRVGQVSDLYFHPNMKGNILVTISLNTDFPIPANSVARIFSSDLMGSKAIEIVLGNSQLTAHSRDTLRTSIEASLMDEVNAQVAPLKLRAESLLSSLDSLVFVVQAIFNDAARDNINSSLASISSTFRNIERTTSSIDSAIIEERVRIANILYHIEKVTASLNENSGDFTRIIQNLATVSDSLVVVDFPGTLRKADASLAQLNQLLEKVNSGEGSIGMLLHNDTLYFELERTAEQMNLLLEDIRVNPKRYVRFSLF
jgi:phospholipid/cholesterol/gamma-HCH transport system substrate-binding protein